MGAEDRYSFAQDAGVVTEARRRWPPRRSLEAFLNDLSFEAFGVGASRWRMWIRLQDWG